ncbi:MAG TPA: ABC transporter permease [Actinomycetota bacterium]|nr:ABC transporter permease [Actinomycetota bacterium]
MRLPMRRDPTSAVLGGAIVLLLISSVATGFPAPLPILVLGAVIGSLVSFISAGIVLIYRSNRIINFAQADIGAVAAVLSVLLVGELGLNYFLAVAVGAVVALILSGLIEVLVVRRFFKAPRLMLTVATIALTQLLVFVQVVLPRIFDLDFISVRLPTPFDVKFAIPDPSGTISPVLFDGNHVLAMVAVPLVIGGLAAFLNFTRAGVAARGAADNPERASLLGVPVKRISTIVWIVAGGLSALGALLRAPTVGLSITGGAFGPGLQVRALAPAVIGRMQNLPATFLAGIAIGMVDQAAFFSTGSTAVSNGILFAVIVVALFLKGRSQGQPGAAEYPAVREVRPIPEEISKTPEARWGSWGVVGVIVFGAIIFALAGPEHRVSAMALVLIYAIVGCSLVVLTGWAGQVSLGQIGFFGVGAAVCASLIAKRGYPIVVAIFIAGVVGAIVAVLIGLPALKRRGLYLAASTLAFGLFVSSIVLNPRYFGWLLPGRTFDRPSLLGIDLNSDRSFFLLVLLVLALSLASLRSVRNSRTGRVLIASKDNERAAQSYGVSVTRARLTAFGMAGFFAAIGGALYGVHQNAVIATAFGVEKSLQVLVMVVIGGLGSLPGAVIGAIYFFGTQYFLSASLSLFASGVGMLVLLLAAPEGIGGIVYKARERILIKVAFRRGLDVPSLLGEKEDD